MSTADAPKTSPRPASDRCPDFREILRESHPDDRLIEQIVHCFHKQLEGFARYQCKNRENAEDALQDALLTMLASIGSYRSDGPLEAWLKKLLVSSCSRLRRGRKNNPNLHLTVEDTKLADNTIDQESLAILSDQTQRLSALVDRLDEPNRSLLLRHEGADVSIKQLAHEFDLSTESVKSRLKRSRAKLREWLLATS